ncbi:MAG: oxidoreductase [Desulfobulbus propionicus]|nr:MAG: oxidoreductase [Desulfobulbus propionicus]
MADDTFRALVVRETEQDGFSRAIETRAIADLPPGEILIRVRYSSLNYKDALSANGNRGVTRRYPHTPGIDAAGIVLRSEVQEYKEGQEVLCSGYDLGMNTDGGLGEIIRVPAQWVLPLPEGLSLKECMAIGTAGFTAAQCVHALQQNNVLPTNGPIVVTGATGGVGLVAVQLLSKIGYEVHALSGKTEYSSLLHDCGAKHILPRAVGLEGSSKMLLSEQWAGAVDTVGGTILANIVKATAFDGVVTACGNAFAEDLPLNVYPFILRGVHLIGIYSADCAMDKRKMIWKKLADEWRLTDLDMITRNIQLNAVNPVIDQMLAGQALGRTVVHMQEEM